MWKDTVVEEVRKAREKNAAKFNYDLKEQERKSGRKYLLLPSKQPIKVIKIKTRATQFLGFPLS
jgi:hypothetical protein